MGKVIRIKSRKERDTVPGWHKLQRHSTKRAHFPRMTQDEVWDLFDRVTASNTAEEGFKHLAESLRTRGDVTHWLGQIGHRMDARLGRGCDLAGYLRAVSEHLWKRSRGTRTISWARQKGESMKAKKVTKKPPIKRTVAEKQVSDTRSHDLPSETVPEPEAVQPTQVEPPPSEAAGVTTSPQMGRLQRYWISVMLIFADCAVQKSPEGVFDVLARNFEHTGALSYWLWRIGHRDKIQYVKRKDIVDAIRKVPAELYRDLSREVGRPVAR